MTAESACNFVSFRVDKMLKTVGTTTVLAVRHHSGLAEGSEVLFAEAAD